MSHEPRIQAIKDNLNDSLAYLNDVLAHADGHWEAPIYSDGAAWNLRQLLIHIGIAEKGMLGQVQRITGGEEGVPADFDLERYNRRSVEKRADMTAEQARAAIDEAQAEIFAWLDSVDDEVTLDLEGRHGSLMILSVERILLELGNHRRNHAQDIANALGTA